jgi:hypothetical protein
MQVGRTLQFLSVSLYPSGEKVYHAIQGLVCPLRSG